MGRFFVAYCVRYFVGEVEPNETEWARADGTERAICLKSGCKTSPTFDQCSVVPKVLLVSRDGGEGEKPEIVGEGAF